jgi:D-serine dehydratase
VAGKAQGRRSRPEEGNGEEHMKEDMTQQPKALQLADAMENAEYPNDYDVAAELRRQHAEIERLTKFCDELICELSGLRMAASMQKKIDALKEDT